MKAKKKPIAAMTPEKLRVDVTAKENPAEAGLPLQHFNSAKSGFNLSGCYPFG
jgi:hypothetical protein